MKKILIIASIIILLIAIAIIPTWKPFSPLRKSEEQIKEDLLKITPIGMNLDDVISVIEKKTRWKIHNNGSLKSLSEAPINYNILSDFGYSITVNTPKGQKNFTKTIGTKSIRVTIGHYLNPFETSVLVFWGFDEEGILIDLDIRKDMDGI